VTAAPAGERPRLIAVADGDELASGSAAISAAAAWLEEGRILAHPTSTVYGLGGRPVPEIDQEIARLKERSASMPLIVVAASAAEIERALPDLIWPAGARTLAARFWPGPLTIVLPGATGRGTAGAGQAERGTAVRVESHPSLVAVLEESGGVMTSTSLNRTKESPIRSGRRALALAREMGPSSLGLALLDDGDLAPSPPSTIVAVDVSGPSLIREGAIPFADIIARWDPDAQRDTDARP